MKTITEQWFGEHFKALHPKIQKLHTHGGTLSGEVNVEYGTGMGNLLGRRLGRKLGLPQSPGPTSLRVDISHTDSSMIWSRQFGASDKPMVSCFKPEGTYDNGCWTETTGNIAIQLGVVVQNGEWHWIQRSARVVNKSIPAFLIPAVKAYKCIKNDLYHFEVELYKRELGLLVRYSGELDNKV